MKFHQREAIAFESLSYMLFCYEHNIKIGIFRFKNQTGIETEPIDCNGQKIGFQAKYYDTKLAENKDDIIDSLRKAKGKNPDLDKIYIYTNKELSESKHKNQKKPVYLAAIEQAAEDMGLSIEWRLNSHFERQLLVPENLFLYRWYFETEKGIVDFLDALTKHTERILFPIHTNIEFNGKEVKVDRTCLLSAIINSQSKVLILSGDGGCGKTALIKEYWEKTRPLYVLKAAEFRRASVFELFRDFGNFDLADFIAAHTEEPDRTFVIDSAEKIADLETQDVFIEFISALIASEWKVIFTTRNSYLDDLRFQMLEIFRLPFETFMLESITDADLEQLADDFEFELPADHKSRMLIRNLFYLQEYLSHYSASNNELDYSKFRELLWQKRIQNSKYRRNNVYIEREECFLKIARIRCDTGNFYLSDLPCSSAILSLLAKEEIIQYEDSQSGYFITHDIYEEWALEKLIDKEFFRHTNCAEFFKKIGSALPMRRAFRFWLSERLLREDPTFREFFDKSFNEITISKFWKDELLISILLSNNCSWFFQSFESKMLENNKYYLRLIIFLLRTACKEVDGEAQKLIQKITDNVNPALVFTKPKGKGWESIISFLHQHIPDINIEDLAVILPLLKDWTSQYPTGPATKLAGRFSLHFYKQAELADSLYYSSQTKTDLLDLVLGTARELKEELTAIIEGLLSTKFSRRDAFNNLRETILKDNNKSIHFILTFPELTLRLAGQTWYQPEGKQHPYLDALGVEKYYAIRDHVHHDYHPASGLQTPIYYLLHIAFPQTIKFILDFTNRAVEAYSKSELGVDVEEVHIEVDGVHSKQAISTSLWCMYRGSGSPVTPYLLQSMHMALEKKLIEMAKITDGKNLVKWLKHLLLHSRSASITAVVTSVTLAHPDKLFEVALILFRQFSFFQYDNIRLTREVEVQGLYSILTGLTPKYREFEKERLATCNEPHRKKTLENLARESQFFKSKEISENEGNARKEAILAIIDEMYASLGGQESETKKDKIIKLFLARIDSRKMTPTVELKDGYSIIHFNPKLTPELKQFSENGMRQYDEKFKYSPLKMWGISKFQPEGHSGTYPQYEGNPANVLKDTKQLLAELEAGEMEMSFSDQSILAYSCAALLKFNSHALSKRDLNFCHGIILEFAVLPFQEDYRCQIADGVEVAISTLPYLYALFPRRSKLYNLIMLSILFDRYPLGNYKRVCDYAVEAIRSKLFCLSPKHANEILLGYMAFGPQIERATDYKKLRQKNISRLQIIEEFIRTKKKDVDAVRATNAHYKKINFEKLSVDVADTIFQLMPDDTQDPIHLDFLGRTLQKFSKDLLKDSRYHEEKKVDHWLQNRFLRKYARFLLYRQRGSAKKWLESFVNPFLATDNMASFISDLISEQDRIKNYDQFWDIWSAFYPFIKQSVETEAGRHMDSIIHNYLLAWPYWPKDAKEWHTLKANNGVFFKKVSDEMGNHPAVLYSISKLLNEIGSGLLDDGIYWISDILSHHKSLPKDEISESTIFYLNQIARRFVYVNRAKIRGNRMIREKILILLNFLFEKGSVSGYLLREEVF